MADADQPERRSRLGAISVDWWATLVGAVIAALAIGDVLPRIPW